MAMKPKISKIRGKFKRHRGSKHSNSSTLSPKVIFQPIVRVNSAEFAAADAVAMGSTVAAAIELPDIAFQEAINDSPRFRSQLHEHEAYFQKLESRVNEIIKHLSVMADIGRNYAASLYKLTVSINQLRNESFNNAPQAEQTFGALSEAYGRTVDLMKTFHEESTSQVMLKLQDFVKNHLTKVSSIRTDFDSMSTMSDEALAKNAALSKSKVADAEETRRYLMTLGACQAHTALDFVEQINMAHTNKNFIILDALWSFAKESSAFFSKGHAFFDEWTAIDNGAIADAVEAFSRKRDSTARAMQDIHSLVPQEMFQHPTGISPDVDVVMEGYLFKRSSNAFKTWNRRWFQIKDSKLLYVHRNGDSDEPTVMEDNLMLCLVRPASPSIDRIGCFELVTPNRTHLLQADSESLCNAWMRALQRTILNLHETEKPCKPCKPGPSHASSLATSFSSAPTQASSTLPESSAPTSSQPQRAPSSTASPSDRRRTEESIFHRVRAAPGNRQCADCGTSDPKWASINLGVLLCIECCGVHRSLGVQVSKIRSLTMDTLDHVVGNIFIDLGNERVNSILLARVPKENCIPRPARPGDTIQAREAWIRAKYVERRFAAHGVPHKDGVQKAINGVNRSASVNNFSAVDAASRREHADSHSDEGTSSIQWRTQSPTALDPRTICMLGAAMSGDLPQLLAALSSGVDINETIQGSSALHAAVKAGQSTAVEFLLLNGAKVDHVDSHGDTPLHIAARRGRTLEACLLMKRSADKKVANSHGETPMQLAVDGGHADIVTLFRVHTMRDEMSDEFDNPMNRTVDDIIDDITRGAMYGEQALRKSPPPLRPLNTLFTPTPPAFSPTASASSIPELHD